MPVTERDGVREDDAREAAPTIKELLNRSGWIGWGIGARKTEFLWIPAPQHLPSRKH